METELTKEMKIAIRNYKPILSSNMRTIRWAEEVDVGTGFVDSIRFEDYIKNINEVYECRKENKRIDINNPICSMGKNNCNGCIFKSSKLNERQLGIMTTCYEMKITKADFKSKNGHNFVGNRNYYVMPKELYPKVEDLIEDDIGVILYYGHGCLRIKKECGHREISEEVLNRLLFNALKKWCDLNTFTYKKYIG
ncbi:hypothetical protein [Clostridium neonatale]|uniref:hypothetical protein n=1 Tax=Clostridium neonatale TaxID=137838 RepID=UPI00374EFD56